MVMNNNRQTCLGFARRCIFKLSQLDQLQPPEASNNSPERAALQLAARRRTVVWADVAKAGWGVKLDDVVSTAWWILTVVQCL